MLIFKPAAWVLFAWTFFGTMDDAWGAEPPVPHYQNPDARAAQRIASTMSGFNCCCSHGPYPWSAASSDSSMPRIA